METKLQRRQRVGTYLNEIRKSKNLSKAEIARRASVKSEAVGWVFSGARNYTTDTFLTVCHELGVDIGSGESESKLVEELGAWQKRALSAESKNKIPCTKTFGAP